VVFWLLVRRHDALNASLAHSCFALVADKGSPMRRLWSNPRSGV